MKFGFSVFTAVLLLSAAACNEVTRPVDLGDGGAIAVSVTAGGAPLSGVLVRITATVPPGADSARTDATGRALFRDLDAGSWEVRLQVPASHDITGDSVIRVQVRLGGTEEVAMVLTPVPTDGRGELVLIPNGVVLLPCGTTEQWIVNGGSAILQAYHAVRSAGSVQVYADLRGSPGHLGRFGAFGVYDRELQLSGIDELRPMRAADCARPGLNLAPRTLVLAVGESAPVDAHWEPDGRTPDNTVSWTSNDESVARIAADGTVAATGVGTAIVTAMNGVDTATMVVRVAPNWYPEGYATLTGTVTNPDGSPAANTTLTARCPGSVTSVTTDASGGYSIQYHYPEGGNLATSVAMSDQRRIACLLETGRSNGIQAVGVADFHFGTLISPAEPSILDLQRKPRGAVLQVDPATFQLSPGGSRRVTALQNGVPTDDVDIRTSNPDIAHAAGDRILHGTSGNVFVIVTAHSDTTSIGFASAIMLR